MFDFLTDLVIVDWAWNVLAFLGLILMFAIAFYGWTSVMMVAVAEIDSYGEDTSHSQLNEINPDMSRGE